MSVKTYKRILITGVAGMLGSHLLDYLLDKEEIEEVIGIDNLDVGKKNNIEYAANNCKFKFFKGDILDKSFLKTLPKVDTIVHFAASKKIGEANPGVENLKINGIGSENIFKLALDHGAKVILGSTSDCYGMSPDLPFREDGDLLLGPSMIKRWSYAVGKLYAEQLAFSYYKDYKLPVVVLRYFGGFSERASFTWTSGHIPIFIDAILKNEECPIHGDGSQTRSMTHVSNLVEGTYQAMHSTEAVGELINIGEEYELSVLDSAKLIHQLTKNKNPLKIKFIKMRSIFGSYKDIIRRVPDLSKAKRILKYEPDISFKEGLAIVIDARRKMLGI